MKCEECKFWEDHDEAISVRDSQVGYCSRFPPPLPPVGKEEVSEWPETYNFHWCGEFVKRK